jgi:SAM-dependent methyltransferase
MRADPQANATTTALDKASQRELDRHNQQFWDELCGSSLARSLGITDASTASLLRFDGAYLSFYPYLAAYVDDDLEGKRVLEIGLGYGTLGQLLASRRCRYVGLDLAAGPVEMMRSRVAWQGAGLDATALRGAAQALPFAEASFDQVYSIGCLHHCGNLAGAIDEVYRVLVPGGKAVVMLYHRHSFRQLVWLPVKRLRDRARGLRWNHDERLRAAYDRNLAGDAAPHTEFVSRREVRHLFRRFRTLRIDAQNFDTYSLLRGRLVLSRERFLTNVGRVWGLDLYIVATR